MKKFSLKKCKRRENKPDIYIYECFLLFLLTVDSVISHRARIIHLSVLQCTLVISVWLLFILLT